MERGLFDALAQCQRAAIVAFREMMGPRPAPDLLDQVSQSAAITLRQAPAMTEHQANDVFRVLSLKGFHKFGLLLAESNDSFFMASALGCLREPSSARSLRLGCAPGCSVPADALWSICSACFSSDSLQTLLCSVNLQAQREAARGQSKKEAGKAHLLRHGQPSWAAKSNSLPCY